MTDDQSLELRLELGSPRDGIRIVLCKERERAGGVRGWGLLEGVGGKGCLQRTLITLSMYMACKSWSKASLSMCTVTCLTPGSKQCSWTRRSSTSIVSPPLTYFPSHISFRPGNARR